MSLEILIKKSESKSKEIPKRYLGDIRRFKEWCADSGQVDGIQSMLDYMYFSLKDQRVKKNTWERRYCAIRKHLSVIYGVVFKANPEVAKAIKAMREEFSEQGHEKQNETNSLSAVEKRKLLADIHKLPTRERAIALVNLYTANKPNEMVQIMVKDFDFTTRKVKVSVRGKDHFKRLPTEVTRAARKYIKEYNLQPDNYFVGSVSKSGIYNSAQITVGGYHKAILRWTGLQPEVLRKTQINFMYAEGAGLPTIAKQSGHNCLDSLINHNLQITDSTIDKYL